MGIVYVITNQAMPGLVKIGRTDGDVAETRLSQLYTSGVPFPFKVEFAARVPNPLEVEQALHRAFAPHRVNPKREFFALAPEQPIAILNLLHVEDVTVSVAASDGDVSAAEHAAGEAFASRRPNFDFNEMGIPAQSMLTFVADDNVKCYVISNRKVQYADQEWTLTSLTKILLERPYAVAPLPYWKFDGKLLSQIYEQTYPVSDS